MQTIKNINQIRARAIRLGLIPPLSVIIEKPKKELNVINSPLQKTKLNVINSPSQKKELNIINLSVKKELDIIRKEDEYESK